jgi:RNA polymerase sigma-70 factor (ECF subfamily)
MEGRAAMKQSASVEPLPDSVIVACQQGDREAFRQLFEAHKDRVWTIALHFTGDDSASRDITQQVFLKLFTTIGQFRHTARFETWLYRLVVNACMDEKRRWRRLVSFEFLSSQQEDGETSSIDSKHFKASQPEEHYLQTEMSTAVRSAVKQLTPKLRIAVLLKHFEDLSYAEMAKVLGCSMGTVASRLNRGHKELARKLAHLKTQL